MSGWGDFPYWEQLAGSVRAFRNNLNYGGGDIDFAAFGRKLWDLPDHLDARAPNAGAGVVVAGPPFFNFHFADNGGHYVHHGIQCLFSGQYRLFLVLLLVLGCVCFLNLLLFFGVACLCVTLLAMVFDFASDNPANAAAFAVIVAVGCWRDFHRDRRGQQRLEQREREQQQHGQERDSEHHQPDGPLEERQPQQGGRKQRQPRRKQRQ